MSCLFPEEEEEEEEVLVDSLLQSARPARLLSEEHLLSFHSLTNSSFFSNEVDPLFSSFHHLAVNHIDDIYV